MFLFPILLLLLVAANGIHAKQQDNLIIGGKRAGPVRLGQPVKKYSNYLGPGEMISSTFFNYPRRKMALLVKRGIINGIMIYSPKYKTRAGVKVGFPISAIIKHYGNYLKTDAGSLVYSELGLSFNEENGRISRIMVVHASPDILLGDKKILPGVRAGNIKIGMDISAVEKYWGKPDSKGTLAGKTPFQIYRYNKRAVKILVSDGVTAGVQINSYKYGTPEGISVGSTREQVIKTYGSHYREVKDSIMYNSLGLGFFFKANKVVEILLTYRRE